MHADIDVLNARKRTPTLGLAKTSPSAVVRPVFPEAAAWTSPMGILFCLVLFAYVASLGFIPL